MPISNEAITQGTVLASILAGFALAAAIQLSLREREDQRFTGLLFFISGGLCIVGVWIAIFFFSQEGNAEAQQQLNDDFYTVLTLAIVAFVFSVTFMIIETAKDRSIKIMVLVVMFLMVFYGFALMKKYT